LKAQARSSWWASIHDVTERRKLEASLALADRLASMGMLAAGVGHEINNPLAYVLANSDTIAMNCRGWSASRRGSAWP